MKKLYILVIALAFIVNANAQWVNDPTQNTYIASTSSDAGEIYLSTDPASGDTYVQWCQFYSNGWAPSLQRLNFSGEPQWAESGIQPGSYYTIPSYSQGVAMTATTDNAVVSCFSTEGDHSVAVKINADGTYAWGEQGVMLFHGMGGSRTELLAGDDGGVWALASDLNNLYLCYIEADGTVNPTITISDNTGKMCMFGLLTPAPNGNVFVVYEKEQWAYTYFYEKDIRVVGYSKNGTQISDDIQLMSPKTIGGSYAHYVVPDGLGGAYVYIWHPAGDTGNFNTYVFHFNQSGASTIMNLDGIPVHSPDNYNFYLDAYATVDPASHDLIIAYIQTDAEYQSESRVYLNRFNEIGERLWFEGILAVEENGSHHSDLHIDAFEYGGGYTLFYNEGDSFDSTVKAIGFDDTGSQIWNTVMSSFSYPRTMCKNTTGHHAGQNIIAWVNSNSGGIRGQNIGQLGEMGEVTPPTPPAPCDAPTNFQGEANNNTAVLSWTAPETTPLHYNLYVESLKEVIEIDPENTSYNYELEPGDYIFKLTAVYEDCESNYALTPGGDNYVLLELTSSIPENEYEEIVNIIDVYNTNGQRINTLNINELSQGIYIIKGVTESGKTVIRKMIK